MATQNQGKDVVLVDLTPEPQMRDKIQATTKNIRDRGDSDVVMDFSNVDIVTSARLEDLIKLHKLLADC